MTWAPPFPQAQRVVIGCVAGAEELAPRSSASSPTGLGHRSGIVLTREEEHVRFEFWKEIDVFPLPPRPAISRHRLMDSCSCAHVLPGGPWWGLRFGSACLARGAGHASAARSHV